MSPSVGCVQVAKKPGEVRTLSGLILLILAIHCKSKDYSITVATRPEPTVRPPSRSDLVIFRNLFVTDFAVL